MFYIARTDKGVSLLILSPTSVNLIKNKETEFVKGTIVQTIDPDLTEGVTYNWKSQEIQELEYAFHAIPNLFKQAKKEFISSFFRQRQLKET